MGRLINHSKSQANLSTKTIIVDGAPRLVLFAARDIEANEELLYDYGDRRKESLANHPWLAF
jgi:histone-lysine N-methyltransferase SETD8